MLGVEVFTQRQFGDVAKPTAHKGLRLAALRALSPLSLSSPCLRIVSELLSSLAPWEKSHPYLRPRPRSEWDLRLDIAS